MEEKRKAERSILKSRMLVKKLDGDVPYEVEIDIQDVSKTGVGFVCNEILNIGGIYEAYLTIWTKEVLHSFLEVVRIEKKEDCYVYGSVFIGMPEMESNRIGAYQTVEKYT